MAYYKPIEQQLAMKIQNNAPCPCGKLFEYEAPGKTKVVRDDGLPIMVRNKYKHCCKGKQLFFSSEERKQEAEFHILQREKENNKTDV